MQGSTLKMRLYCHLLLGAICSVYSGCGRWGADSLILNGICDGYERIADSSYILPFAASEEEFIPSQGDCSASTHKGNARYAYDFGMPVDSEIMAIRSGVVIDVVEKFENGSGCGETNLISVLHEDGSNARYLHLTFNGAIASEGQAIDQGDTIALSGNTGCSTGPHLHIEVTKSRKDSETIPISFSNVSPPHRRLFYGMPYIAE